MKKTNLTLAFALFASLATASTGASAQQTPQCLSQNTVNGWKVVNDQTLIVSDRVGRQYLMKLDPGCHDLKWPSGLGFSAGTGFGISCLQHNDFVNVPANGGDMAQRCVISSVQPYTRAMLKADASTKSAAQ